MLMLVRSRIDTALLLQPGSATAQHFPSWVTQQRHPLLIAMPPYRQVPVRVRQIEGVNFYRRDNQLVSWDLIVRSRFSSVVLVVLELEFIEKT